MEIRTYPAKSEGSDEITTPTSDDKKLIPLQIKIEQMSNLIKVPNHIQGLVNAVVKAAPQMQ
jgi:hypothetical protein